MKFCRFPTKSNSKYLIVVVKNLIEVLETKIQSSIIEHSARKNDALHSLHNTKNKILKRRKFETQKVEREKRMGTRLKNFYWRRNNFPPNTSRPLDFSSVDFLSFDLRRLYQVTGRPSLMDLLATRMCTVNTDCGGGGCMLWIKNCLDSRQIGTGVIVF